MLDTDFLRNAVDLMPFHVFWMDNNLKGRGCNRLHEINFDLSAEKFVGKSIPEFAELMKWEDNLTKEINYATIQPIKTHKTCYVSPSIQLSDGKEHHFLGVITPIIQDNTVSGIVGFGLDLTRLPHNHIPYNENFSHKKTIAELVEMLSNLIPNKTLNLKQLEESKIEKNRLIKLTAQTKLLSKREKDCIKLLSQELSSVEISILLSLSKRTIEHYISNAKDKLNCKNVVELIFKCAKVGLIP